MDPENMAKRSEIDLAEATQAIARAKARMREGEIVSKAAKEFLAILNACQSEREITNWLQSHPLLIGKFAGARYPHVFKQFPIGSRFPDFVVLDSFSGGWDVTMIELEPPNVRLFTKEGNPARRLAGAIKQVDDWRNYVMSNRQEVLVRLSEYYMDKDMTYGPKHGDPRDCGGLPLADSRSTVYWHYCIVIGRRATLSDNERALKAKFLENHRIEVATHDRLVELFDQMKVFDYDESV